LYVLSFVQLLLTTLELTANFLQWLEFMKYSSAEHIRLDLEAKETFN